MIRGCRDESRLSTPRTLQFRDDMVLYASAKAIHQSPWTSYNVFVHFRPSPGGRSLLMCRTGASSRTTSSSRRCPSLIRDLRRV